MPEQRHDALVQQRGITMKTADLDFTQRTLLVLANEAIELQQQAQRILATVQALAKEQGVPTPIADVGDSVGVN